METIKPCCRDEPDPTEYELRRIRANDPTYNALFNYANNYIKTSKYTFLTFVPLNLFEQFQRLANFYFLCLLVLQLIPQISSLTPITTAVPLIVVLTLTALKDAIDDMQRHRSDGQVNNRRVRVLRGGQLLEERWHKVQVGDIIRMENDQFVAADLLLLSSSEPNGLCYIETAELDGETNLKSRQAVSETAELGDDHAKMGAFDGEVVCEAPNNHLSRFEGRLSWQGGEMPLDNGQMLLRGCVLRNTRWCYGMVVFAGRDTKLMQNSGRTIFKRTSLDRLLNLLIIGIVFFLLSMCLFCTVACGVWESVTGQHFRPHLPWDPAIVPDNAARGATVIALLVFFSYAIVLNTVVPISLYVSVEVIRFWHSLLINWDERLYDPVSDTPARARTTTLNEELGQIEYVFSDKTGTLTRNEMAFSRASIKGHAYGELLDDLTQEPVEITETTQRVDFSGNPEHEPAFRFYDPHLLERVQAGDVHVHEFFRILALCHTVMPEDKDGRLEYQAQSPDEAALTSAARNFGFVFKSRTPSSITIEVLGKEEAYELLAILDFNNVRKRMSVILRKNGQIKLYSKGADSVIFERLASGGNEVKVKTTDHLNKFASEGLRTLCLAYKDLDENVYNNWNEKFHQASVALEHREERLNALYEDLEQGLVLVGATAIEDKLQDGVPQAIANLALAGIKIWVLTGDKQETAINIGYSCQLLTDELSEVLIVDGGTALEVERQLDSHRRLILSDPACATTMGGLIAEDAHSLRAEDAGDGYALVINGHSLVYALQPSLERLLVEVCGGCRAVICCRVTPLQKALVVDLVKRHKGAVTLAIGDGANDVSMIKTAHIGVGISGAEGTQAVLASDFAVAQFRHLERLLLVHGRWSYLRMSKFLRYFFYKNFAFTLCHFWFAFFCGFSAQTLYDPFFISFYNVFYTSLPVLALGVFDQDVSDRNSLRYPKLYTPGLMNLLFNKMVFLQSVAHGLATSFALFFVAYGAFSLAVDPRGRGLDDLQLFGSAVSTMLVLVVTLQVSLDTTYWTAVNHCVVWGSALFFLGTTMLVSGWSGGGALRAALGSAQLWFALPLAAAVSVAPAAAMRFAQGDCRPTLSDRVRMRQRLRSAPSEPRPLRIARPSRRSIRSGYAFAHQEGFGRLIMSGKIMRKSKSSNLHNSLLPPWQRPQTPSSPSTVDI